MDRCLCCFSYILISSALLGGVSGDEFWSRHGWRNPGKSDSGGKASTNRVMQVDLGVDTQRSV